MQYLKIFVLWLSVSTTWGIIGTAVGPGIVMLIIALMVGAAGYLLTTLLVFFDYRSTGCLPPGWRYIANLSIPINAHTCSNLVLLLHPKHNARRASCANEYTVPDRLDPVLARSKARSETTANFVDI